MNYMQIDHILNLLGFRTKKLQSKLNNSQAVYISVRFRSSHPVSSLRICPSIQQEPDYLQMTPYGCPIKGSVAILTDFLLVRNTKHFQSLFVEKALA